MDLVHIRRELNLPIPINTRRECIEVDNALKDVNNMDKLIKLVRILLHCMKQLKVKIN